MKEVDDKLMKGSNGVGNVAQALETAEDILEDSRRQNFLDQKFRTDDELKWDQEFLEYSDFRFVPVVCFMK